MADALDWIVSTARQKDASLDHVVAESLAAEALRLLPELPEPDAPELARRLLAANPDCGPSAANVVAKAAVDFAGS
jgi:hypothetical protein